MTVTDLAQDEYHGDEGKSVEQVLAEVEEFGLRLAQGDPGVEHETRPSGYGKLLETYEWRPRMVVGMDPEVRAWCLVDSSWMTWTLKTDPRYSRVVKGGVEYKGLNVEAWECRTCGQWTVK